MGRRLPLGHITSFSKRLLFPVRDLAVINCLLRLKATTLHNLINVLQLLKSVIGNNDHIFLYTVHMYIYSKYNQTFFNCESRTVSCILSARYA